MSSYLQVTPIITVHNYTTMPTTIIPFTINSLEKKTNSFKTLFTILVDLIIIIIIIIMH